MKTHREWSICARLITHWSTHTWCFPGWRHEDSFLTPAQLVHALSNALCWLPHPSKNSTRSIYKKNSYQCVSNLSNRFSFLNAIQFICQERETNIMTMQHQVAWCFTHTLINVVFAFSLTTVFNEMYLPLTWQWLCEYVQVIIFRPPTLSILLKSSLSTRRKWQLSSLRTMEAARGESVTRANFPKSSPSWSVHTTPWHTGTYAWLHTCQDTNTAYSETRTRMNPVCLSICDQSAGTNMCEHMSICCTSACTVAVWFECVFAYNALSHLIIVMSHDELSRVCQTPLLVFPSPTGHILLVCST